MRTGTLRLVRKDKAPDCLLRAQLPNLACGHPLRETVVGAR